MSTNNVVSKNLYELLGNNHDEDSDKEPEPPVKVVDKTPARTTKRNAPAEAPASSAHAATGNARGGRRGGFTGSDGAFRDRNAGRASNQGKPIDENAQQDRPPRTEGTYRGRGGRGRGGGGGGNFDRHSRGVGGESEKQSNHGWGALDGGAELANAEAGEAIAKAEGTEALTGDAEGGDAVEVAEPEPEDNSVAYADYLAQQAEKKLALGTLEIRKVNEGKVDKKWAGAKAIAKEEEEDFVAGTGGKSKRERERTAKKIAVDIDQRFVEPPERGERGGRGGGFRGGRGRGDGAPRGRGEGQSRGGRGEGRGDRRPRGDGSFRGSRGGNQGQGGPRNAGSSLNTDDKNAFPSLGA